MSLDYAFINHLFVQTINGTVIPPEPPPGEPRFEIPINNTSNKLNLISSNNDIDFKITVLETRIKLLEDAINKLLNIK
jgi:hypothetical protein